MKKRISALLILTLTLLSVSTFYPTVLGDPLGDIYAPQGTSISDGAIDGTIGTEWDDAGDWAVTDMANTHKIRAKHDGTYLYILLVVADNTNDTFDPANATAPHDWAGVDFDINGDEEIMGSTASADDFEYCDYKTSGGEDWWMKGIMQARGNDTSVGGSNDVFAARGFNTTHTILEFKKILDSGDTAGYDIAMDPNQTCIYGKDRIKISLAYQDGDTGKHSGHSHWYLLILTLPGEPIYGVKITDVTLYVMAGGAPRPLVLVKGKYLAYSTWTVKIQVIVKNNGTVTANYTVNAYYSNITGTYQIGTSKNITNLDPCNNATVTFDWDLSGVPVCAEYTVKANATSPSGASHELVMTPDVKVTIKGNVNDSAEPFPVNILDVGAVAWTMATGGYECIHDLNLDGAINILDVGAVAWEMAIGAQCPP